MSDFEKLLHRIRDDDRYRRNLDYGQPRPGHPEGTVRAHIEELERNLLALRSVCQGDEYWRLAILVHVHDTFKADAKRGVAIDDPRSHASLARAFLAEFCDDPSLLAIVQYHDEPYALWRQHQSRGRCDAQRFSRLLTNITEWELFLRFLIIDGCTEGKGREPLLWFFDQIDGHIDTSVSAADLL